jgi:hypothetical protein
MELFRQRIDFPEDDGGGYRPATGSPLSQVDVL